MAPKKQNKTKKGGADTMSADNLSGSMPRASASTGTMSASTSASMSRQSPEESSSFFSGKSASRLLEVPASTIVNAISSGTAAAAAATASTGGSFIRYSIITIILLFLGLNLFLYLEKPKELGLEHLYDPVYKFFGVDPNKEKAEQERKAAEQERKAAELEKKAAVNKLEKVLDEKKIVNNIDKKNGVTSDNGKKLPKIPKSDDTTSLTQMKPKSKSGFCYIGEDRGFRSCIDVEEGDVCMSGDIFPTKDICINPNLRE